MDLAKGEVTPQELVICFYSFQVGLRYQKNPTEENRKTYMDALKVCNKIYTGADLTEDAERFEQGLNEMNPRYGEVCRRLSDIDNTVNKEREE